MSDWNIQTKKEHLISRLKRGDAEALRPIYLAYYQQLLTYGCSIEPNENLVHDEIQELFVWLLKNPEKWEQIDNLKTYLFKSLRRNVRSSVKKNKESRIRAYHHLLDEKHPQTYQYDWAEDDVHSEQIIQLRERIEQLPSHQREIVYLRFYENLSNDEIAEIFSVSNQVVRNTLYRALKNLRKSTNSLQSITVSPMIFLLLSIIWLL